jgi:hydrogenase nickel incorporation protein HypA/HybF
VHELGITRGVVEAVRQRLPEATVTCVRLELGALSGIAADSVRFCFDLLTPGTNLDGASLEITETAARCRCNSCGDEFEPDDLLPLCPCGSADVEVLCGQGIRILSVQLGSLEQGTRDLLGWPGD